MLLAYLVQAVLDPICFRLVNPTIVSKEWKFSPNVTYPHRAPLSRASNAILRQITFAQMQLLLNKGSSQEGTKGATFWDMVADWQRHLAMGAKIPSQNLLREVSVLASP